MTRLAKPLFGLDYTNEIPVSVLKAAKVHFVVRYLSRYSWKVITAGERQRLDAAGIGICLVFEDSAGDAYGSYANGKANAEFAVKQARSLGFGREQPIYFADDLDSGGRAPYAVGKYYEGVASVMTPDRCGPYGDFAVCELLAKRGFKYCMQTYAWSRGRWSVHQYVRLYQYSNGRYVNGHNVDFDEAWYEDYGQHNYKAVPVRLHPDQVFTFKLKDGHIWKLNEHDVVAKTNGALKQPKKYHTYLSQTLYPELKLLRDRVYRIAKYQPPDYTKLRAHPVWSDDRKLGARWQSMNNLMGKIHELNKR